MIVYLLIMIIDHGNILIDYDRLVIRDIYIIIITKCIREKMNKCL